MFTLKCSRFSTLFSGCLALYLVVCATTSQAAIQTITSATGLASVSFDDTNSKLLSYDYSGINQFSFEQFFFRGGTGGDRERELGLAPFSALSNTVVPPGPTFTQSFVLMGGFGSGTISYTITESGLSPVLTETISLDLSAAFTLFQLTSTRLNGSSADDNSVYGSVAFARFATTTDGGPVSSTVTYLGRLPDFREVGSEASLLASMGDGSATAYTTPSSSGTPNPGVPDGAFGYQWSLSAGHHDITITKQLDGGGRVPEPAALGIWGGIMAVGLVASWFRRRKA